MDQMPADGAGRPRAGDRRERLRGPFGGLRMSTGRRAIVAVAIGGAALLAATACGTGGTTPSAQVTASTPPATDTSGQPTPTASAVVPSSPSGTGTGTPRCHAGDLSAAFLSGDGHHGSATLNFTVTNTASHDCLVSGVPTVRAVDGNGKTLATAVRHQPDSGRELVLHAGGKAYISIDVGLGGMDANANKAPCNPPAAALWLIPYGETAHLILKDRTAVCNGHFFVDPFTAKAPAGVA